MEAKTAVRMGDGGDGDGGGGGAVRLSSHSHSSVTSAIANTTVVSQGRTYTKPKIGEKKLVWVPYQRNAYRDVFQIRNT